jgi:hypothetical protein
MADDPCRDFFLQPSCVAQRQYEALRCVFVDGRPQKETARRFGYSYAAFRQLVCRFRSGCSAGQPPPLLRPNPGAGRPAGLPTPAAAP